MDRQQIKPGMTVNWLNYNYKVLFVGRHYCGILSNIGRECVPINEVKKLPGR